MNIYIYIYRFVYLLNGRSRLTLRVVRLLPVHYSALPNLSINLSNHQPFCYLHGVIVLVSIRFTLFIMYVNRANMTRGSYILCCFARYNNYYYVYTTRVNAYTYLYTSRIHPSIISVFEIRPKVNGLSPIIEKMLLDKNCYGVFNLNILIIILWNIIKTKINYHDMNCRFQARRSFIMLIEYF